MAGEWFRTEEPIGEGKAGPPSFLAAYRMEWLESERDALFPPCDRDDHTQRTHEGESVWAGPTRETFSSWLPG